MTEITKPQNFLNTKELMSLQPSQRKIYVHNKIMDILRMNENGVTISEVEKATGFDNSTVWRHLENLVSIREAYKKKRGPLTIYYKNGKLGHQTYREVCIVGNKSYVFDKIENNEGHFILIQEKEMDSLRKMNVKGGIMINIRDFPDVMKTLLQFCSRAIDE